MERLVGIRGATCARSDTKEEVHAATRDLLAELLRVNGLQPDDIVSIWFTATPDLHSAYPAEAARHLGLTQVALLGAQEIDVPGALPRVIRVLVHAYGKGPAQHVFQREARGLRPDLTEAT